MIKEKHIHKLRRHIHKSGNVIYFCMLPDCNFKIAQPLALGKRSLCHRCGNDFIMNEYAIRLAKPHCEDCHKPKLHEFEEIVIDPPTGMIEPVLNSVGSLRDRLNSIVTKEDEEI